MTTKLPNSEPSLAVKVASLCEPGAIVAGADRAEARETHMSWVFFAADRVYKLKKPVKTPFLDFSTVTRRWRACEAEMALNQMLAPGVYFAVLPLTRGAGGVEIAGAGEVVDWLVAMRRLDESRSLDGLAERGQLGCVRASVLACALAAFYRRTKRVRRPAEAHLAAWRQRIAETARVVLDPRLGLPTGAVRRVLTLQRRFLGQHVRELVARAASGLLVDGHGDLRPEHIWPGPPVRIIDRLEFSTELRAVDPLDELASLEVDLTMLGASKLGRRIRIETASRAHIPTSRGLDGFYRSYRALLRARLAIAHLLDANPRTPEKWPAKARGYLAIALAQTAEIEAALSRRADR